MAVYQRGRQRETDYGMLRNVDRAVSEVADNHSKRLAREEAHDLRAIKHKFICVLFEWLCRKQSPILVMRRQPSFGLSGVS